MKIYRFLIIPILILIWNTSASNAGVFNLKKDDQKAQDTISFVSPYAEDNERCFKCHGQDRYEYSNENLGKKVKELMCSNRIVDRNKFYNSNHKTFSCTDCHSESYTTFPHPGELRMEQKLTCLDCHGGDMTFAQYNIEKVDSEYVKSTHYKLENEGFSCWKCHDPHSYKITARTNENMSETISYDNAICLNCHSDFDKFKLLSESKEINIIRKHDWLPNQKAHFQSVRCLECHTRVNDSILVSHNIRPKGEAVRLCNECHSKNSLLMSSLYKYKSVEGRRSNGFVNGIILNESYVIGANRNAYLNIFSIVIFLGLLGVIMIHVFFRIRNNKKISKGGKDVSLS